MSKTTVRLECTKDLIMKDSGLRAFTAGRIYNQYEWLLLDDAIVFVNDFNQRHAIGGDTLEEHFRKVDTSDHH